MRKLFEIEDTDLIKCDNESCDYTIVNESGDINTPLKHYINRPCPKCGENLLTVSDFRDFEKLRKTFNWYNKWFSWITIFYSKKNYTKVNVNVHEGIHLKKED